MNIERRIDCAIVCVLCACSRISAQAILKVRAAYAL